MLGIPPRSLLVLFDEVIAKLIFFLAFLVCQYWLFWDWESTWYSGMKDAVHHHGYPHCSKEGNHLQWGLTFGDPSRVAAWDGPNNHLWDRGSSPIVWRRISVGGVASEWGGMERPLVWAGISEGRSEGNGAPISSRFRHWNWLETSSAREREWTEVLGFFPLGEGWYSGRGIGIGSKMQEWGQLRVRWPYSWQKWHLKGRCS